jgi:glutamine synthetase
LHGIWQIPRLSAWALQAFVEDVQAHYANMAHIELDAFGRSVTDCQRYRSFERM